MRVQIKGISIKFNKCFAFVMLFLCIFALVYYNVHKQDTELYSDV